MSGARRIRVRGQVQGVGYRPFVWQVAGRFGVSGWVLNDAEGVLIEVWGGDVAGFEAALTEEAPALARVVAVEAEDCAVGEAAGFEIRASGAAGSDTGVTPDAASCATCVAEVMGEDDPRRRGYAFTNCTHCGPRFTILRGLPYDRAQTTMADFTLCADCAAEYADPADRRFHAQPVACPKCGPRLWFEDADGKVEGDAIALAAERLRAGAVLAVKGLGGFHLCCDATNGAAVALLRARKRRPAKPLALMAPLATVKAHARVCAKDEALLTDPAAPIVLLETGQSALPEGLAPGQGHLGWMLPYTPLHHLLCRAVGRPLVMTSGNLSGEPQVIGNAEARDKLAGFVDGYLMHDRDIARRLDDSVERAAPRMVLRRARGRVPGTIPLPEGLPDRQVVAYGGQMKSAICLVKGGRALLGHHLGELDEALTWEAFVEADRDYAELFDHRPEAVAVDLHPDFRATRHGRARAEAEGLRVIEVQHHHAHMAAALGEAGWVGDKAVGQILDGLGLGPDGTVWGGEVLCGDYAGFERSGYLAPAPLIGGDRAQAEPWRNALVRLDAAGLGAEAERLFPDAPIAIARQAAASGVNAPMSSSAGRLFDAVAACLGLSAMGQSYEGEAAMQLEALAVRAMGAGPSGAYDMARDGMVLDPAPMFADLIRDLARGTAPEVIAARVHAGIAQGFAGLARDAAIAAGTRVIALSGGCFQNALLLRQVCAALADFELCVPQDVPANDGGLAFGQVLVALARMGRDEVVSD